MDETKQATAPEKQPFVEPGPRVLAVGGSDPSGAAGIQADLKTFTALGVFGASAITAVTAQNQKGVTDVMPLTASFVGAQIDAAMNDARCDVVKTGMLVNVDIVHALADRAGQWGSSSKIVIDPVLKSSSGRSLLDAEGREALLERLLPISALITPNLIEAEELTGKQAHSVDEMSLLGDYLLARGANAVLIKGGHLVERDDELEEITDLVRTIDGEEMRFTRPRLKGPDFRGTGCTLASAISAKLAEGHTLRSAVEQAGDYVHRAMETAGAFRNVRGLNHSLLEAPKPGSGA